LSSTCRRTAPRAERALDDQAALINLLDNAANTRRSAPVAVTLRAEGEVCGCRGRPRVPAPGGDPRACLRAVLQGGSHAHRQVARASGSG
jgi:hypothetical protein